MSSEAVNVESFPVKSEEEKNNFVLLLQHIHGTECKEDLFCFGKFKLLNVWFAPQTKIACFIAP